MATELLSTVLQVLAQTLQIYSLVLIAVSYTHLTLPTIVGV